MTTFPTLQVVCVLITTVLGIVLAKKWKDLGLLGKIGVIAGIITACVLGYNNYAINENADKANRINAQFVDISSVKGAQVPTLELGQNTKPTTVYLNGGVFRMEPFGDMIQAYIVDKKLFVNVYLFDLYGKPVATIQGNTCTPYSSEYEYQSDETAFEVVTKGYRNVFFQIDLVNGRAKLSGFLLNNHGLGMYIGNRDEIQGVAIYPIKNDTFKQHIPPFTIKRLFKYPAAKYPSERE